MFRRSVLEETCSKIISFCNRQSLKDGSCIHSPIIKLGLQDNLFLSNNLMSLYSKRYGVEHARQMFDEMPCRDVVSWSGLLSAYVNHGRHEEALRFFELMKLSGESPNEFTLSSVLRSCSALGDLGYGTKIQACMIKYGLESNVILCSGMIELYSKCDFTEEILGVFNSMANRDTVSWTIMISSLVQAGNWIQSLWFFIQMIEERIAPNEYTFVKLLGACSFLETDYGKIVHAQSILWGVKLNLILKTALVDMYGKRQRMEDAMKVLKRTSEQDVKLWTAVITGFTKHTNFQEAVRAFQEMVANGIVPNNYCYAGILNACSSTRALHLGKQIHTQLIMARLDGDTSAGNALVNFYAKCSIAIEDVIKVFNGIALPNVISWTTLITGLAAHGLEDECFLAFDEMRFVRQQPNSFTLSIILQVCGTSQSPNQTRKIHGYIVKTSADNDIIAGNALLDAYAVLSMVDCALHLVKEMRNRNVITYTILASRLNQRGFHNLTLDVINHMCDDDLQIDGFIISSFLSASADLGATQTGRQLHCYSIKVGFGRWISVMNGLIDLYGKCSCIHDAQKAFVEIDKPDVISWNGFIYGLAFNGYTTSAFSALEEMRLAGVRPDSITLLTVLFACNSSGLVDLGVEYFHSLSKLYDIQPQLNHYGLLVDLLGRAGRLEEAMGTLRTMPFKPSSLIYKKMLQACKLHGNILLGEEVAMHGLELDPLDIEFYALLASIYDEAGLFDLGDNTRNLIKERGLRITPAYNNLIL